MQPIDEFLAEMSARISVARPAPAPERRWTQAHEAARRRAELADHNRRAGFRPQPLIASSHCWEVASRIEKRRRAVAGLMDTMSSTEIADRLRISPSAVRDDMVWIRTNRAAGQEI